MAVSDYGSFPRHQDLADLGTGDPHPQYLFLGLGTLALRPASVRAGRVYYATDEEMFFLDNGTSWVPMLAPTAAETGTGSGNFARSFLMGA